METTLETTTADEMTCPACNARQSWSDQCRRCKCDLSLLGQFHRVRDLQRRRCLQALNDGRPDRALDYARRYAALAGAAGGAQLLAVCHLLNGNWELALRFAREIE